MLSRCVKSASGSSLTASSRQRRLFRIAFNGDIHPAPFHQAQSLLAGNAEKISGQRSALRIEAAIAPQKRHKYFLHDIFGSGRRSADVQGKAVDRRLTSPV